MGTETQTDEYEHGSTVISRRNLMRSTAAAGAIGAGATASSGSATAQEGGWGGTAICSDYSSINIACQTGAGVEKAASWLLGSGDGEETVEDYLEDEMLRLHGRMYISATQLNATHNTISTWIQDNAQYSEGDKYTKAILKALEEIKQNDATRTGAMDAAEQTIVDDFSVTQEEVIQEYHNHLRRVRRQLNRLTSLASDSGTSTTVRDVIRAYTTFGDHTDVFSENEISYPSGDEEVTYTLYNGDTVTVPSFATDIGAGEGTNGSETYGRHVWYLPSLRDSATTPYSEGLYYEYDGSESYTGPGKIEVKAFDDAEYRSVYDDETPEVDGRATLVDPSIWGDAMTTITSTKDQVVADVRNFVDSVYADLVDGNITAQDIKTHGMMVEEASDDQPHVQSSTHLALLGQSTGGGYTTITLGELDLADGETATTNGMEIPEEFIGEKLTGTIMTNPAPSDSLQVGSSYTPGGIGATISFVAEADGGSITLVLEDEREFTINSAQRLDENGEVTDVDEITFSDSAPTETPTDYDDMHAKLDEMEAFQTEVLNQQRELVEKLAEDDEGFTLPPIFGDGNGTILLIVAAILAVLGIQNAN